MRVMARAVIIVLTDSSLLKDQPGVLKVPFAGGIAVLELSEPGALIVVKTILPPQGTAASRKITSLKLSPGPRRARRCSTTFGSSHT
jgi:hypothetical protein